jgi:energy-coupling factor transporter ATPase
MGEKSTPLIRIRNLQYAYNHAGTNADEFCWALKNISHDIDRGEYVAVIGANGSGKSTLLRHLNALLLPKGGDVWVNSWNTRDMSRVRDIRSAVGMVFQSPDAQIVATVVDEDVAFGPENLGVPRDEIQVRVNQALEEVGLGELRKRPTHYLSAGQKQLLAIASALSMRPECLVLDEATASLDPQSRSRLLQTLWSLNQSGITVITATHRMDEAALAKRIIVLSEGEIVLHGHPKHVFSQPDILHRIKLDIPEPMKIARHIASRFSRFTADTLTVGELVDAVLAFRGMSLEGS